MSEKKLNMNIQQIDKPELNYTKRNKLALVISNI